MKNNLIGISGKANSGKDTVGKILQYLEADCTTKEIIKYIENNQLITDSPYQIKKFANKLKDIVCLLIGCTREQLEDEKFKNTELGKEWWFYTYTVETWEKVTTRKVNYLEYQKNEMAYCHYDNLVLVKPTSRKLLQLLGTEFGRDIIHPNIWVNSLFSDYQGIFEGGCSPDKCAQALAGESCIFCGATPKTNYKYPYWIITDVRFENEAQAIKDRGGTIIRVNRDSELHYKYNDSEVEQILIEMGYRYFDTEDFDEDAINEGFKWSESVQRWSYDEDLIEEHPSETALDNYQFDYVIDNNGTLEELINKVKQLNSEL